MAIDISPAAQAARQEQLRLEQMLRNEQFTMAQFAFTVAANATVDLAAREDATKFLRSFFASINPAT